MMCKLLYVEIFAYQQLRVVSASLLFSQHANLAGTLSGHSSWVLSVAFCTDNQHFVTG